MKQLLRPLACGALLLTAASCNADPPTEFGRSHSARVRGVVRNAQQLPLDSVRVMLRIPTRPSAVYDMPSFVTGVNGEFELTVHRIGGNLMSVPDTVTAWVVAFALSPRHRTAPSGNLVSDSAAAVITFVPTPSQPPVTMVVVQLPL